MQTETVTRVRGTDQLQLQTLCPAEPWRVGQAGLSSGDVILVGWRLYLGEGADVTARDRVMVRGAEFSVVGDPSDWLGAGLVVEVAEIWTAQCAIRHPGGTRGAFNETTGTYPVTPHNPFFTGECRVEVLAAGDQRLNFGGEQITQLGYLVIVDLDTSTACRVDDLVELSAIDAHGDPLLEGRTLQLRAFARGQETWQRNLICTDFLPPESVT